MQWEHYNPEEATWELKDAMGLAHSFLFKFAKHSGDTNIAFCSNFVSTKDSVVEGGGDCNTPVLTPWY